MKKRDLEKLRDAFDIPEPEHKSEFIAEHGEKFIKKKSDRRRPLILRYAPTVAFAVMLIGLWGVIKPDGSLKEKPGGDNVIIETSDEKTSVTTTSAGEQYRSEIVVTTTAVQTEKKPGTTVTADSAEASQRSEITSQSVTTDFPASELPALTEAAETTTVSVPRRTSAGSNSAPLISVTETTAKRTSSAAGTSATAAATTTRKPNTTSSSHGQEVNHVGTTVTKPSTNDDNNTTANDNVNAVDLTVAPDPVYKKTDKIYEIEHDNIPGTNVVDGPDIDDAQRDLVINGCVTDIFYTKAKNMPYTQINILITDMLTNTEQLSVGYTISVYIPGGYMPSDEYFAMYPDKRQYDGDYTVYYSAGIYELPEQGDIYRFFLKKGEDGIPEGAFVLVSEDPASMFKI